MAEAGYSGTPQLKKLGIVPGRSWDTDGAPGGWTFEEEPPAEARAATDRASTALRTSPPGCRAGTRSANVVEPGWPHHGHR